MSRSAGTPPPPPLDVEKLTLLGRVPLPLPWGLGPNHSIDPFALLRLPLAFSQNSLLSPEDFVKRSKERGVRIRVEQLSELHRKGVLVPILGILRRRHQKRVSVPIWQGSMNRYGQYRSNLALALDAATEGLLVDPKVRRYGAWAEGIALPSGNGYTTTYPSVFYSPYQLLALRAVESLCREMTASQSEAGELNFTLPYLSPADVQLLDGGRRLAILLSGLDMEYLPNIFLRIAFPDEWDLGHREFDALSRRQLFGLTPEELVGLADGLLFHASTFDPLGRWYDLIRRAHPDTWKELEGSARLAMDYRIASEVLLRFVEDLGRADLTKPPPQEGRMVKAILDDRLGDDRSDLEPALMDRGLSTQPSLLLLLEGKTEMLLMPRVLEILYGGPVPPTLIEPVDMDSIDVSLDLLVRYVLGPRFGRSTPDVVLLNRPPTKVLVAVDPEKRFETPAMQKEERKKLVRRLLELVPAGMRTPAAKAEIDTLVTVTTWGKYPWEFANFTDRELAEALMSRGRPPRGLNLATLMALVHAERLRPPHPKDGGPNIERVCQGWPRAVRKRALAEELWPVLERKIRRSAGTLNYRLPAGRVAVDALRLAVGTHRRNVGMRLR